jgi:hypothetical protein
MLEATWLSGVQASTQPFSSTSAGSACGLPEPHEANMTQAATCTCSASFHRVPHPDFDMLGCPFSRHGNDCARAHLCLTIRGNHKGFAVTGATVSEDRAAGRRIPGQDLLGARV